jgi:hypothetical protein
VPSRRYAAFAGAGSLALASCRPTPSPQRYAELLEVPQAAIFCRRYRQAKKNHLAVVFFGFGNQS